MRWEIEQFFAVAYVAYDGALLGTGLNNKWSVG